MKPFLLKSLLFSVFMVVLLASYEVTLLFIPNEYSYKQQYMEEHADEIDIMILGHSQTAQGIMPSLLSDSAFNMAIEGRPVWYDAAIAERYVPRMKNLKCVVWPLGYDFQFSSHDFSFSTIWNGDNGMVKTYRCMYYKYMDIPCGKWSFLCWSEIFNSKFEYGKRFFTRDKNSLINCRLDGFDPNPDYGKSGGWEYANLPSKINDYHSPEMLKDREDGMEDIMRIVNVCKRYGVRLVVVTPPCYKTYQDAVTKEGVNDMLDAAAQMKQSYSGVEYRNYLFDNRFNANDFFNSSHLSETGAKKFSVILRDEML